MYEKRITLKDTCPVCGAKLNKFEYNVNGKNITFLKIDCEQCHTRFSYKPNELIGSGYNDPAIYEYSPEDCWNGQS